METYFFKNDDLLKFYERIEQEYDLYVPVKAESALKYEYEGKARLPTADYFLKKFSQVNREEIVFNEYRVAEPTRAFLTHYKEDIGNYKERPQALCGIKNCDIFSLKVQDFVFLGGKEVDPLYKARRDNTLVISGDCPHFKEVCFCRAFDINPYPAEGFDFNLSPLNNGYLLDVASQKAKMIALSLKGILTPATLGQLSGRTAKRESVNRRMDEHLAQHKIPKKEVLQEVVLSGYNSEIWQDEMHTCVECNGCVFMCDTCHCFLLSEDSPSGNSRRLRLWDGCLLKNFTKVAGGANPLRLRYMRLRNRYLKKFDFFIANLGYQACCGCGRCIEVCPGKIDIRRILRKLYEEKYIPAG
ncbi:MAG: 4Fe-4S dicluster domain-containing protein [Candidatus Omnitrophica bacterium]|nr:4Fe-4S dicluster domain-containing protein [Candidatus Omnitrophota bacterium]MDD5661755.1 4Fe-4S dicluster domain-containing protein [Candidatus Omnitrophota bacterium]